MSSARDYWQLTKPRVVALIVFTALVGMFLAVPGLPPAREAVGGLLGIWLAAASAAAINHLLDRRIDEKMARTSRRPLPTHALQPRQVLVFALLMQWLKPSDTVIRVVNQLVKLLSIFVGAWVMLGRGGDKGMLYGALLGLVYMAIGVGLYALLSGQQLPLTAYLSDIAMGVAGGGIAGAIIGGMQKK